MEKAAIHGNLNGGFPFCNLIFIIGRDVYSVNDAFP